MKMKLIAWIVCVCFFLLTEAGRVPDKSEISNSDELDDKRNDFNNPEHRRHKRYYSERRTYQSYYDSFQDRIRELEIRVQIQQEQIDKLQLKPTIITIPILTPQWGNINTTDPGLTSKFNIDDEEPPFWGPVLEDPNGNHPMSLKPNRPNRPMPKQPPVEHGTVQAVVNTKSPSVPLNICTASILICCDKEEVDRKSCFIDFGCTTLSNSKRACDKMILDAITQEYITKYANDTA